jgi:predicted GIY-YIG superfamily endonuclease
MKSILVSPQTRPVDFMLIITRYTRQFQPWKIIHVELFADKSCALKREQLKSVKGRTFTRTLVKGDLSKKK